VARGWIAKDYVSNIDDALIWPMFVESDLGWRPNLQPRFVQRFGEATGLKLRTQGMEGTPAKGSEQPSGDRSSFDAFDMLGYLYAILNSPRYRLDYRESLCLDFPRVPMARYATVFWQLSSIGRSLVRLHLLEHQQAFPSQPSIRPGSRIEQVRYDEQTERVFIDASQSIAAPRSAWEYVIGAHQLCKAWLTARRGCRLRASDAEHFQAMVQGIVQAIEVAAQADAAIEEHGGWQESFLES
jgi:hypothetical protein